ncbi:MAG: hypothetical protein HOF21_11115 [Nitrospina sp.]|nr:hypothetical protein [Nitrospina sp.]
MTEEERQIRKSLKENFGHYASKCLKIRAASGELKPFTLNAEQNIIHEKIEAQLKQTGKVRALILKGRKQGCSTYVEGRYYWKVTHSQGKNAFILCHEAEATKTIFDMAARYHEHCPELVKPQTGATNAKELSFDTLDSGYRVATAGSKGVGRSQTIHYFHGSEVAFWPNANEHSAGALQAVPNENETEIILESTANGLGNYFHEQWQQAEAGIGDYIAIFIPWFLHQDYRRDLADDFNLSPEELEYKELYGLDNEQMAWRQAKAIELKSDWLFKQEYPATSAEAFQTSGEDTLISPDAVMRARKVEVTASGPLVIGVDPAWFGDDRTSIIRRQGRKAFDLESYSKKDTMEVAGIVARIIENEHPIKVFVDVGGIGAGVYDRLRDLGYTSQVEAVNAASKTLYTDQYSNKRAEMWGEMKEWLHDEAGVDIPDLSSLHADLTGPTYSFDSNSRLKIEKKEDLKKRGFRSPDEGDALALTFAAPVNPADNDQTDYSNNSGWMS